MKIVDYQRDLFGASSFQVETTAEETEFLIHLALDTLFRTGKLTLDDLSNEIDLSSIPIEEFYSA